MRRGRHRPARRVKASLTIRRHVCSPTHRDRLEAELWQNTKSRRQPHPNRPTRPCGWQRSMRLSRNFSHFKNEAPALVLSMRMIYRFPAAATCSRILACDDLVGWANALASPRFPNDVKARLPTRWSSNDAARAHGAPRQQAMPGHGAPYRSGAHACGSRLRFRSAHCS